MKGITSISLIFFLITAGCIGPGENSSNNQSEQIPFEFDLTIEDMWNDIPSNQTSASDIINLTYEFSLDI